MNLVKKSVVKDNVLVNAKYKLSIASQRLVALAIIKARDSGLSIEDLSRKTLEIHASDYVDTFDVDRQTAYESLKNGVLGLYNAEWGFKTLTKRNTVCVEKHRFTQSAIYNEGDGSVGFMFAEAILPYLVQLELNFTSYKLEQLANLKSTYAFRLYELLLQFKSTGLLVIKIEDLRFSLGLSETEYATMSNFKSKLLHKTIKEINENTDITVTYTQKKRGRVITHFEFKFNLKQKDKSTVKQVKSSSPTNPPTVDMFGFDEFTEEEAAVLQKEIDKKIAYAESQSPNGKITGEHKKNIIEKVKREKIGLDVYWAEKENEKKKAENLRLEDERKAEADRLKIKRDVDWIEKWELMGHVQQQHYYEKARAFIPDVDMIRKKFEACLANNTAYKNPTVSHFVKHAFDPDEYPLN